MVIYKMYEEILEQPNAIRKTLESQKENLDSIARKISETEKIYLIGCGSSLSTCYSAKYALEMVQDVNVDVLTGYEFYYHKKISNKNSVAIFTSQSGETADTRDAMKKANEEGMYTAVITNEKNSSMAKKANIAVVTEGGREEAILGTKTYVTQLMGLYYVLFGAFDDFKSRKIFEQLTKIPDIMEKLIKSTEKENKELANEFKDENLFYCIGSGPNYGLAYKLAMTMLMEGALKHACPLYSGEFRHGLIERVEKDVPVIFLDSNFPGDILTQKSVEFCENIGTKNILFRMQDYADINSILSPFILVIPLEWFIYYLAHFNGEDPGSTRHIGKVRY
ncbi:SIS domain-containing protein [Methanobacterium alcaliphilum]|uniref:SIS domain-containing protein n=1 Tax=Methanobacterium alcaliphilum TaxID=392018 RepID=UPI00200A60FF|nr:SIS domain-containing protein [Methanobacterium alcaliphilum]MCK9152226.1 SIS domain-containing protein [Methanobacterium alcaliphilum]